MTKNYAKKEKRKFVHASNENVTMECTYLSLLYWATEDSNMARPIFYGSAHPIQNIWCLTGVPLSQRARIGLFTLSESSSPTQAA